MSALLRRMELVDMLISGTTRLAGVLGCPVAHSLSPALHNAAFASLEFDAVSVGLEVSEVGLQAAVRGLEALGAVGASVTMPHKRAVVELADECTETVRRLGAANCLTFANGRLHASSTDGQGLLDALAEQAAFQPEGKKIVLLGAGGAAAAIAVALCDAGADLAIVTRRQEAADNLALIAGSQARRGSTADVAEAELVINATPLGMAGTATADELPVDAALLHEGQVVFDTIYAPRETPLLKAASSAGAIGLGGLSMLVHQARHQLQGWTGQEVSVEVLWSAVAEWA
jgi:shikimate dehydrogenase